MQLLQTPGTRLWGGNIPYGVKKTADSFRQHSFGPSDCYVRTKSTVHKREIKHNVALAKVETNDSTIPHAK